MKADVLNLRGEVVRSIDLDDRVFGIEPNHAIVHQAVVTQQANARQGTHDTKTRAEVAGGGKKPYRQKGTGNARQGSTRAPHYRKGGIVFGPHPRSYEKAMPKKMRRLAMRSVLSARAAEQAILVLDELQVDGGKTRGLLQVLMTLGIGEKALLVTGERTDTVLRAARNLASVHAVTPNGLCLLDMLRLPRLVLTESAVQALTRTLTSDLPIQLPDMEPRASSRQQDDAGSPAEQVEAPAVSASKPARSRARKADAAPHDPEAE